jgi:hypothetical protein
MTGPNPGAEAVEAMAKDGEDTEATQEASPEDFRKLCK